MEHFYRNTQIVEYARMVDFIKDKPSNNYTGKYDPADRRPVSGLRSPYCTDSVLRRSTSSFLNIGPLFYFSALQLGRNWSCGL